MLDPAKDQIEVGERILACELSFARSGSFLPFLRFAISSLGICLYLASIQHAPFLHAGRTNGQSR
jgi:hypothetical protein